MGRTSPCWVCLTDPCDQDAHDEHDKAMERAPFLCDECGRHLPCRRHPTTERGF